MTTHYQKIQALGNRMAENLTIMGVPSQFDEGGLTLADKILEISGRVTSGIILYADKKIAQSEDTVNLYALVLDDNTAVSGETVRFYADAILRTATINNNGDWIGDDYWVSTSSSDTCWIGGGQGFIQFNSTTIKIFTSSWSPEYSYTGKFHIKDGVLTYTDTNDETQTIDVSGLNLTKAYGATDPFTVYYTWVNVTTGSNGVATYAYTCTGSGLREFYVTSGTFVSETYSIYDTIFKDIGNTDNSSNWNLSVVTYAQTDDYVTLDNSSGASRWIYPQVNGSRNILDTNTDYCWEIDLKNVDATNLKFSLDGTAIENIHGMITTTGFTTIKIYSAKSENKVYYEVNGVTRNVTASTLTGEIYIRLVNGETFQFKNMKVYPI